MACKVSKDGNFSDNHMSVISPYYARMNSHASQKICRLGFHKLFFQKYQNGPECIEESEETYVDESTVPTLQIPKSL